jgi:Zn-dependent protease
MQWSWSLGRLFGIETRVHASFVLILAWAFMMSYGGGPAAVVYGFLFLAAVFASVVAHEFGHALTARGFGVATRQILLLPIGGVAQIEGASMPPRQELLVAVAGPAVSFMLAGVLFGLAAVVADLTPHNFIGALAWANLGLGAFNLLPAFPMDGGRVLRAALSLRVGPLRATEIAAAIGKVAAVGLGVYGVSSGRGLMAAVAVFLFLAARSEANFAACRYPPVRPGERVIARDALGRIIIVRRGR